MTLFLFSLYRKHKIFWEIFAEVSRISWLISYAILFCCSHCMQKIHYIIINLFSTNQHFASIFRARIFKILRLPLQALLLLPLPHPHPQESLLTGYAQEHVYQSSACIQCDVQVNSLLYSVHSLHVVDLVRFLLSYMQYTYNTTRVPFSPHSWKHIVQYMCMYTCRFHLDKANYPCHIWYVYVDYVECESRKQKSYRPSKSSWLRNKKDCFVLPQGQARDLFVINIDRLHRLLSIKLY